MRLLSVLATVALLAGPGAAFAGDPSGHYTLKGSSPDGHVRYDGVVDVSKTGDTYKVNWVIDGTTYFGTGIGNENGLAVSYISGGKTGIAIYFANGDNWKGVWTYAGGTALGAEDWSRN